jgi:hypothetical protein
VGGPYDLAPKKHHLETAADELYAALKAYASANGKTLCYNGGSHPYFFADSDADGTCSTSAGAVLLNPTALRAAYNLKWAHAEPGAYAHNFEYMEEILYDSIVSLGATPSFVVPSRMLTGPVYPPPGGVSWSPSGNIGFAGGVNFSYSALDPSAWSTLVWGASSASLPGLAFDGTVNAPGETMAFDPASIAAGELRWTGQADLQHFVGGILTTQTLPTRLVITFTGSAGPVVSALEAGVPPAVGGVVRVAGPYVANLRMEAYYAGAWQPALTLFNGLQTVAGTSVRTSFGGGFYYAP